MSAYNGMHRLFHCLVAGVALASFIHSSSRGQDETAEIQQPDQFEVYAMKIFGVYDVNKDGYLSAQEMELIDETLTDKRFDLDSDGQISMAEMTKAVQRPSSPKVEKVRAAASGRPVAEVYFKNLVEKYDSNGDGMLSFEETNQMRQPLRKGVDANSDGHVTADELMKQWEIDLDKLPSKMPRKNETPGQPAEAKVASASPTQLELEELHLRFLEASLSHNDRNRNGQLDPAEIGSAIWSSPWRNSDSNGDGILSRNELKARYKKMFAGILNESADQSSTPELVRQTRQPEAKLAEMKGVLEGSMGGSEGALMGGMMGSGRQGGGMMAGIMGGQVDGDALALLLNSKQKRNAISPPGSRASASNSTRGGRLPGENPDPESRPTRIGIDLYLLRTSTLIDAKSVDGLLNSVKSSPAKNLHVVISSLAEELGVKNYDHISFTTVDGDKTKLTAGAQVPIKTGATTGRNGVRTDLFENREVGLDAEIRTRQREGYVSLEISLSKSDVIETEELESETFFANSVNWEYSSTLRIEQGSPAVVTSSSNKQRWILVARATVLDGDLNEPKRRVR